jgi:2-methylfumaryl-CoA hydratase
VGQVIDHAVPRTVSGGERALYHALYPARHALYSSDAFAQASGLPKSPMDDLIAFHVVFGKTVPDVSLNAVANLGYAEGRFLKPVYEGDTLRSRSEVIGVKENSNGKTGVVYVRTQGLNQNDEVVMEYVRWVMVRKRDVTAPAPDAVVPDLKKVLSVEDLVIPEGLDFTNYDFTLAGEEHRWADYEVGEKIDHVDGVTIEEAEHMLATRLWQNTAKVHFDATFREDGKRLIYGGHVISMARALSFNGLANAQMIAGINGGAHANPCFAGDTVKCWTEVLDKAETSAPGVGALRLRLVATKGGEPFNLKGENGKYLSEVLLDLDYWVLIPC